VGAGAGAGAGVRTRERRKSFEIMKEGEEIRKPFNECDSIVATARSYKTFFGYI
jgi:hypothetical protein